MSKKKNKTKHSVKHAPQLSPVELLKQSEEQLRQGQTEQALLNLLRIENNLRQLAGAGGQKAPLPSHLIPVQSKLPGVLASALAANSLKLTDPQQRLATLERAVKSAPTESRYRVALGAQRLLLGQVEAAFAEFQKADELSPDDKLATRAFALGLLANGRAREAGELLKQKSEKLNDQHSRRLADLADLFSGSKLNSDSHPLLSGLSHLAQNEISSAQNALAELPMFDHNPTRDEAALLAAQFFYSGVTCFLTSGNRQAMADWREARRLAKAHQLDLPWSQRLTAYYHRLAERTAPENLSLAIECWQEILEMALADKIAAHNLMNARRVLAQQAWRDGHTEQAATIWQELLQLKPADETLLQNAALANEKLDRKDVALVHWRALARTWRQQFKQRADEPGFKNRLDSLQQRVLNLMREAGATPEDTLNELEAALKFAPEDAKLLLEIVQLLMEMGKSQRALKYLDQLERQHGKSATLFMHKAMATYMLGNFKSAQTMFKRAIELEPDNRAAKLSYLGVLGREADEAEENDNPNRAIELCEEQLQIDPNYAPAQPTLASLYFQVGRKSDAKALLKRSIEANPDKPQPYVASGAVYWEFGLKKEAKAAFAKALELDSSAECHLQIGLAYLQSCEHKEAVKSFEQAAPNAPFEMLLEIGILLFEHGEKKDAKRFLGKAKKLDPTNPIPYLASAMLTLGKSPIELMLASNKERKEALKELAEAERLMAGRKEFDNVRSEIGHMKRMLEQTPSSLLSALGGLGGLPPFLLDDDPDDEGFFPPIHKRKKKK
jgi:tetratricopeptide (TPR) repeat protein